MKSSSLGTPENAVRRRTLARGVAWSAPVLAAAAAVPAYAASQVNCQNYRGILDWNQVPQGTSFAGTTFTTTVPGVTMTGTNVMNSGEVPTLASGQVNNGTINYDYVRANYTALTPEYDAAVPYETGPFGPVFNISGLDGAAAATAVPQVVAQQTVTFTFSEPVTNLSFTVYDIDYVNLGGTADQDPVNRHNHRDRVGFSPAPSSGVPGGAGSIQGSGSLADPYLQSTLGADGTMTVTFAGPLTTLTMVYDSFSTYQGAEHINLSNFALTACLIPA